MGIPFRDTAGFGKRIEYWVIGRMLKEGLDVYVPLVDDNAVDAVVRRKDDEFAIVQIKARSKRVKEGNAAYFSFMPRDELRPNYWFVFYSERLDKMWIMSSKELISEGTQNKKGKYKGMRAIQFSGKRINKTTGQSEEFRKPQFEKYIAETFDRVVEVDSV